MRRQKIEGSDEAFVVIRRIVLVLFICREAPLSKHFIIYILYKTRRSEVIVILKMAKRHRRRRWRWRRDESSAFTHYIIYNNGNNFISRYALRTPEWAEYVIWACDTSRSSSRSSSSSTSNCRNEYMRHRSTSAYYSVDSVCAVCTHKGNRCITNGTSFLSWE